MQCLPRGPLVTLHLLPFMSQIQLQHLGVLPPHWLELELRCRKLLHWLLVLWGCLLTGQQPQLRARQRQPLTCLPPPLSARTSLQYQAGVLLVLMSVWLMQIAGMLPVGTMPQHVVPLGEPQAPIQDLGRPLAVLASTMIRRLLLLLWFYMLQM
jgi:hypothetical protein